jgi:DNA-directed RNA polymerase subunit RPC12/RpoP
MSEEEIDMEKPTLNFVVRCAHCEKPFHLTAKAKSDEAGDEEVALNCPYCDHSLTVTVPRAAIERDALFRGAPELASRKA